MYFIYFYCFVVLTNTYRCDNLKMKKCSISMPISVPGHNLQTLLALR